MRTQFGIDAGARKRNEIVPVVWDSSRVVNGHMLLVGMSGAGKTFTLRKLIRGMIETAGGPVRVHVFDVHGDIDIDDASTVMFSEQTQWGLNPLQVSADPHFGGVRKRVQGFISTMNRVMRQLGPKQEAALRNVLYDVYAAHGFKADDPSTWHVPEAEARLVSDGQDNRFYIDVPRGEKDEAKALGARWHGEPVYCWWIEPDRYQGAITRWPPKLLARTHPSIRDVLRMVRHILHMSFLGTGQQAVTNLELANKAATAYQRRLLEALRRGEQGFDDEKLQADLDKARAKAIEAFTSYANSIATGQELETLMKYDSTDVLKSVVDRIENLDAIGVFKAQEPPFDPSSPVWRYNIKALSLEERKLFVLFRLQQLFEAAVARGVQDRIVEILVLDEAHIYADDDPENIINNIAKEARKFGIALICASQSPTHFTEDFVSSVATKVVLGIDESYWRGAATRMRIDEKALAWIRPKHSMMVQMKTDGETRNNWQWTIIE